MRFAIVADGRCAGFVLRRRDLWEAFDESEQSLGTFDTEPGACTAIFQKFTTKQSTISSAFTTAPSSRRPQKRWAEPLISSARTSPTSLKS